MEALPQGAQFLGHDVQTVMVNQPPLVQTTLYQPPKQRVGYSLSHYDEDHGDHIVHRQIHRDAYYVPPAEFHHDIIQQPPLMTTVPITRYYSVPVTHVQNTQHIDYQQHQHIDNVVTHVPTTVESQDVHHKTVTYQEPVTTMVTRTVEEPYVVTHRNTVMKEVVTPTVTTSTVPVVHNQQTLVTDNHVVAVPV